MAWQGSNSAPGASTSQTTTAESSKEKGSVSVSVGGVSLSLKSDKNPQLVEDIAAYVNEKVGAVREAAPSAPLDKALMLASLTVAEELFDAQARLRELETTLRERVDQCLSTLDELDPETR